MGLGAVQERQELDRLEWGFAFRDDMDSYRQRYAPMFVMQMPDYAPGDLVYVYPLEALGTVLEYYWCPECGWSYDVLLRWPVDGRLRWQVGWKQVIEL